MYRIILLLFWLFIALGRNEEELLGKTHVVRYKPALDKGDYEFQYNLGKRAVVQQQRNTVVLLLRELRQISELIAMLDEKFMDKGQTDVTLFLEAFPFAEDIVKIRNSTRRNIDIANVQPFFARSHFVGNGEDVAPSDLDAFTANPNFRKGRKWSYNDMCRFYFSDLFELPIIFDNVKYLMRLDDDSIFLKPWSNIFDIMQSKNAVYFANTANPDSAHVTIFLERFLQSYMKSRGISPKDAKRFKHSFPVEWWNSNNRTVYFYYNNFEITSLAFFRSPEVKNWTEAVMKSHGIFRYRWGDHVLRYVTLTVFAEKDQVLHLENYPEFSYCHACEKPATRPKFLPRKNTRSHVHAHKHKQVQARPRAHASNSSLEEVDLPPLIFVHMGNDKNAFPHWIGHSFRQALRWNPDLHIYFIALRDMLSSPHLVLCDPLDATNVNYWNQHLTFLAIEDIPMSTYRSIFDNSTARKFDESSNFRSGFWRYSTERLFVLHDALIYLNISECFHTENDNLIYVDLKSILSPLRAHYPGMTALGIDSTMATLGFTYIAQASGLATLLEYSNSRSKDFFNEMPMLTLLADEKGPEVIGFLPVIFPEYNASDFNSSIPLKTNYDAFEGIFDACQYGQYLGGIDRKNRQKTRSQDPQETGSPGFANIREGSFNPKLLSYKWDADVYTGLRRIYISTQPPQIWHPLFHLHIHDKESVERFVS